MTVLPGTNTILAAEHGPNGGDEVNLIKPGLNYGWPNISFGRNYDGPRISPTPLGEGIEQPQILYVPSVAPTGLVFYTGDKYPQWKNNLFVSALGGQQLRRLEIDGDKVTHQEQVFNQFGRVHDVIIGPDGYLYVTLQLPGAVLSQSTSGMIARLIPVKQ